MSRPDRPGYKTTNWRDYNAALIFGTLASTALTVFVVPILYERLMRS